MIEASTNSSLLLALALVALLVYFLGTFVPRVERMVPGYRSFAAITTLGFTYLVTLSTVVVIVLGPQTGTIGTALSIAVVGFAVFGLTLLADLTDEWIALFTDPEYSTWAQLAIVVCVLLALGAVAAINPP